MIEDIVWQIMAKRRLRKQKAYSKFAKDIYKYPTVLLVACVLIINLGAWLAGGFSTLQAQALNNIQVLASPKNTQLTTQNYSGLVWQGEASPIQIQPESVPVLSQIPTTQPLVFLGIDDGWVKSAAAQEWLLKNRLPFTLFLTDEMIKGDYSYFYQLMQAGMSVQNHTLSHTSLNKLGYEGQKAEICGAADLFGSVFGSRPTLLRPPFGDFNALTIEAARQCGMKAIIMWHAKANGGSMQYQNETQRLQPGDIVLMHFRDEFMQDMQAFMDAVQKENLQIARLEDFIP